MDLFDALLFSLISLLASSASSALGLLARLLVGLFATVFVTCEAPQVLNIDAFFAVHGWCSTRRLGAEPRPADGVHFSLAGGLVVAVRATAPAGGGPATTYTVYVLTGRKKFNSRFGGAAGEVEEAHIVALSPWNQSMSSSFLKAPPARELQAGAASLLAKNYLRDGRCSALVCGPTGAGKSSLGRQLAAALAAPGVAPLVVRGFDPTAPGLTLEFAVDTPSASRPIILMIDEFDNAVEFAERTAAGGGAGREQTRALAETPPALTSMLDRLGEMKHVIVIATSNKKLAELADKYGRYIRRGRLDIHFTWHENEY